LSFRVLLSQKYHLDKKFGKMFYSSASRTASQTDKLFNDDVSRPAKFLKITDDQQVKVSGVILSGKTLKTINWESLSRVRSPRLI